MNSVTPTRPEKDTIKEKEGAGKGVVLFCCALFLLFQVSTLFSNALSSVPLTQQLAVVAPQSLKIVSAHNQKSFKNSGQSLLSSGNYHFAPFFFEPIAINYCDKSLLMSLKGIGPSLAESIVATRRKRGSFQTAADLLQVKGIGPGRLLQFAPYFDFTIDHEKE